MAARRRVPFVTDRVKQLHAEGLTDTAIAQRLGVSQPHVSNVRRKLGLVKNVDEYDCRGCKPAGKSRSFREEIYTQFQRNKAKYGR